jgi:heat shock protein HslJ
MAAACGADTSTDVGDGTDDTSGAGEETDGTSPDGAWVLVDSMVDGTPLAVLDGYAVTMNIDSGDLGGRAACNSYGGTVVLTDTDFSSSDLFQTEMGCEEPAMSLEFAYLSSLGRVVSWARTGDALTLAGDGVSLTFELVPPPPTADLVDTAWILDTIIEGEAASSTISGAADARLLF